MKLRLLMAACCVARFALAQPAGCVSAGGTEIRGKDLAASLPAFRALPADLVLGRMPIPGSKRTFRSAELKALAQRHAIELHDPPDVCFQWPMKPLERVRVLSAMRDSLAFPDVRIEIVDSISTPVPQGEIEFRWQSLEKPAPSNERAPVLWRGAILYEGGQRYAIWARVRITASCGRAVATENLKAGAPITPNQLSVEPAEAFPDPARCPVSADPLVGMTPLRPIAAGTELRAALLQRPFDVTKGELVEVEVQSGRARLALTAKAEMNGRDGEVITVRNPASNRVFRARVSGKGRATVSAGLPGGF